MEHGAISQPQFTEDELKLVLMDSHEEGVITEGEAKIIIRAFEFADKRAEEIMIPAERVDYISLAPGATSSRKWPVFAPSVNRSRMYCLYALTAASSLPSKAAVHRLVTVTLAGLRPPR